MRQMIERMGGILGLAFCMALLSGCRGREMQTAGETAQKDDRIHIGLSFDSFIIERWQRDRDAFVARASELGAEVNVQCANGEAKEQAAQIEYLIEKDMDVIVIIATDYNALSEPVRKAKREGVRVIAYDRLIKDADVDLYITFDNERVGEMMAETILARTPEEGKIFMMCGSPEDNNVSLVMEGFHGMIDQIGRAHV